MTGKDHSHDYLYYGLNFLLAFLSFVIPKNKKQILVGSKLFTGNPKYFYLYLCKNKKETCNPFWITKNKKIFYQLKERGLPTVYLNSWKGFCSILRAEYLLFSHDVRTVSYFMWLPGRFKKIQLWHAIATKGLGKPSINKNAPFRVKLVQKILIHDRKSYHTIVSNSEKSKKRDVGFFQNKNVKIFGLARNDVFFDKTRIFDDLFKQYNLDQYNKVILYAPTWRENRHAKIFGKKVPFTSEFLNRFNDFLKKNNYIIVVKKHDSEIGNRFDFPNFSNIIHISKEIDIQELLVYVDVLITDYSSVLKDFCLTGKPIILYPFDFEEYSKAGPLIMDYFNELPGPFAKTEDELMEYIKIIEKIVIDKKYRQRYSKLVNDNHYYKDGKSSERLYNYLCKNG